MARILLSAPSFFGYRQRVSDELVKQGHHVDCIDDRPSEGVVFKSLGRISYGLVDGLVEVHATRVREQIQGGAYDQFLYMGGMSFCFTREQFARIREAGEARGMRFVAYLWDALSNCQRFAECADLFDEVMSFEPGDCESGEISLRPLFYGDAYQGLPVGDEASFDYDACFIGSVHQPSKFEAVSSICQSLRESGMRIFSYFYMPSTSAELLRKATNPAYRGVTFEHESISAEKVSDIYARSVAIIDSPQAHQRGLTMRTLETLGAKRKLITANADVRNYDFYKYGNVAVWDESRGIDAAFFSEPYQELPKEIYDGYSIASFVRSLVGEGEPYSGYEKGGR
ncbi:hypothetical protein [Parafannyhessea umbonata]|uniref:Uncharacterized protein n=1 Tax=Parafannyhessea umbonata TaxID=604330 RepID=A0A1H9NIX6_9ACTN|nr:hypothetical protein [Parafannyhessea umbonata]SER35343.1 hypothetical protein SAMN05216446_0486 [Parafannyhessea umbonata]